MGGRAACAGRPVFLLMLRLVVLAALAVGPASGAVWQWTPRRNLTFSIGTNEATRE